ncbi:MAG: sulfurtransferase, partial [Acidimicrobiia bacterium]
LGNPVRLLVDSSTPERYRGINETLDPVGGHIPGAANYFFQQNLTADKRFKSPDDLKIQWDAVIKGRESRDVVVYCGSGVTACHNLLALEYAGFQGVRIYPGSWSEWSADPARPKATTED